MLPGLRGSGECTPGARSSHDPHWLWDGAVANCPGLFPHVDKDRVDSTIAKGPCED